MKQFIYTALFLWCSQSLYGQPSDYATWPVADAKDFVSKMETANRNYKEKNYKIKTSFFLYSDDNTQNILDKNDGYFIKYNRNYISMSQNIYTMQNERIRLVIDSSQKLVIIKNTDKYLSFIPNYDKLTSIVNSVSVIRKKEIDGEIYFYIDTKPLIAASAYLFKISKNNFISEMIIFYRNSPEPESSFFFPVDTSEKKEKKKPPVLKIKFSHPDVEYTPSSSEFREEKYIFSDGKNYHLSKKNSQFKILDMRVK